MFFLLKKRRLLILIWIMIRYIKALSWFYILNRDYFRLWELEFRFVKEKIWFVKFLLWFLFHIKDFAYVLMQSLLTNINRYFKDLSYPICLMFTYIWELIEHQKILEIFCNLRFWFERTLSNLLKYSLN
jgi:hypothetical protein